MEVTRNFEVARSPTLAETIFDAVVVGGGPAGYTCAIRSAQLGLKKVFGAKGPATHREFAEKVAELDKAKSAGENAYSTV